jgi:hypothetical protein
MIRESCKKIEVQVTQNAMDISSREAKEVEI